MPTHPPAPGAGPVEQLGANAHGEVLEAVWRNPSSRSNRQLGGTPRARSAGRVSQSGSRRCAGAWRRTQGRRAPRRREDRSQSSGIASRPTPRMAPATCWRPCRRPAGRSAGPPGCPPARRAGGGHIDWRAVPARTCGRPSHHDGGRQRLCGRCAACSCCAGRPSQVGLARPDIDGLDGADSGRGFRTPSVRQHGHPRLRKCRADTAAAVPLDSRQRDRPRQSSLGHRPEPDHRSVRPTRQAPKAAAGERDAEALL
jgi:hypothetical protein